MNTHINFEIIGKMAQKQIGYQSNIKTIICSKLEFQEILPFKLVQVYE